MPLHLCVLASGSRANAILLSNGKHRILIDAGLGPRSMAQVLKMLGAHIEEIEAVFITHEHIDHVRGLGRVLENSGAAVYASEGTLSGVDRLLPAHVRYGILNHETVEIGPFAVRAIPVPHDAAEPTAYHITAGEHRVTVATDLGKVTPAIKAALRDSTCIVLESNHDEDMLREGSYPEDLKERILSNYGHLSNRQTATALRGCPQDELRTVVLAHLSDENNHPRLAHKVATTALAGRSIALHVTTRSNVGPFLNLDSNSHNPTGPHP